MYKYLVGAFRLLFPHTVALLTFSPEAESINVIKSARFSYLVTFYFSFQCVSIFKTLLLLC